jgi:predicted nucleic acid-binding protein
VIVVDASVLVDTLLGRVATISAVAGALVGSPHEPLHAPDLIELETLNALRRHARSGAVTELRATEAVADLANLRLVRYPHEALRLRVWELRHELTAYDAAYLALAEVLGDAKLLTADGALAGVARRSLGRGRVLHAA